MRVLAQAAQLAEVYWMALTRDVPFSKYGDHDATITAAGESRGGERFGGEGLVPVR